MKKEFEFKSADGITDIHCVKWDVENPKAVLQVAHGMSEFIERYEGFAKYFNEKGIVVVGNDHIGHGSSIAKDKAPMYFGGENSWGCVVDDLFTLYEKTKKEYPELPYYVFGLSLGSFLMRALIINYTEGIDGAILVGTSQASKLEIGLGKFMAERERKKYGDDVTTDTINDLTFGTYNRKFSPTKTEMDWLCSNEDALNEFLADERRGKAFTVGLFRELLNVMSYTRDPKNIEKMNKSMPILIMSGEKDPVGSFTKNIKKLEEVYKKSGMKDITVNIYPGLRHDILNEVGKEKVFDDINEWMEKNIH